MTSEITKYPTKEEVLNADKSQLAAWLCNLKIASDSDQHRIMKLIWKEFDKRESILSRILFYFKYGYWK